MSSKLIRQNESTLYYKLCTYQLFTKTDNKENNCVQEKSQSTAVRQPAHPRGERVCRFDRIRNVSADCGKPGKRSCCDRDAGGGNIVILPHPRTAIGQIAPLHYLFIVVDGRTDASDGMSLQELAQEFVDRGADVAYNLDGGGSSAMWLNGALLNNPTNGRRAGERNISDIIYIGY